MSRAQRSVEVTIEEDGLHLIELPICEGFTTRRLWANELPEDLRCKLAIRRSAPAGTIFDDKDEMGWVTTGRGPHARTTIYLIPISEESIQELIGRREERPSDYPRGQSQEQSQESS